MIPNRIASHNKASTELTRLEHELVVNEPIQSCPNRPSSYASIKNFYSITKPFHPLGMASPEKKFQCSFQLANGIGLDADASAVGAGTCN